MDEIDKNIKRCTLWKEGTKFQGENKGQIKSLIKSSWTSKETILNKSSSGLSQTLCEIYLI